MAEYKIYWVFMLYFTLPYEQNTWARWTRKNNSIESWSYAVSLIYKHVTAKSTEYKPLYWKEKVIISFYYKR